MLAGRLVAESTEVADELQRLKTMNQLEGKMATVREGLEFFGGLREWGVITEEELLEKRRALLDLGEPPTAELDNATSQPEEPRESGKKPNRSIAPPNAVRPPREPTLD